MTFREAFFEHFGVFILKLLRNKCHFTESPLPVLFLRYIYPNLPHFVQKYTSVVSLCLCVTRNNLLTDLTDVIKCDVQALPKLFKVIYICTSFPL